MWPSLFISHGSPMLVLQNEPASHFLRGLIAKLPKRPRAIVVASAHWETAEPVVLATVRPQTIHDFYGFPQKLYEMQYPAEGLPELARLIERTIRKTHVEMDFDWGLDHGAWSVLGQMFPKADIPVVQLSLDLNKEPEFHYELGMELKAVSYTHLTLPTIYSV